MGGPLAIATTDGGDRLLVTLTGAIDEHAELAPLAALDASAVDFDLADVSRINSCGVREWVALMRAVPPGRALRFRRCSLAFVTQLNMIGSFAGHAVIESFYAPYVCERCGEDHLELLRIEDVLAAGGGAPVRRCPNCTDPLAFDELPERYFSFCSKP